MPPRVLAMSFLALLLGGPTVGAEVREKELPKVKIEDLKPGIPWAKSLEEARKASSEASRPLLMDFKAEWCGPCKKLERETYGDEAVIKLVRRYFVAVKVDIDEHPALAKRFHISGVPTTLVLSPGGEELRRVVGFRPPETFIEEISKAARSSAAFEKLKEEALSSPDDAAAQQAYARALVGAGNAAQARKVLEKALERKGEHAGLLLELADVLRTAGHLSEAAEAYEKVLELDSETAAVERRKSYVPLARCHIGLERDRKGIDVLNTYLALPASASSGPGADTEERLEALYLRGYAHARLKDADKALSDLKAARDAAPKSRWGIRAGYIIDLVEPE